jgi:hypothetical protein
VRRDILVRMARFAIALGLVVSATLWPTCAEAQTYQVSVEETGPLPTVYTKRFNWRYLTGYRHTTMVPLAGSPTLCSESPCLDDDLPGGGLPPDLTRGGTARATVPGMSPGVYRLELRFNQTVNRATSVPWAITTDAATNESRSGALDQKNTAPGTGNWWVLGQTDQNPVSVKSTATFSFGSDTKTFNGSLSYGGIRLVRVGDEPVLDAGTGSDAGGDAASDAQPDLDAGGAAGVGGAAGSAGAAGHAASSGGNAGVHSGVVPADDAGCGCRTSSERKGGSGLLLALIALLRRSRRRAESRGSSNAHSTTRRTRMPRRFINR